MQNSENNHLEKWPDIKQLIKRNIQKTCTKDLILNRFPIIKWLPNYKWHYLYNDTIAGISVALTAIPQGMGNAVIAGLEPQYALYSEFMASSLYCVFGTCRQLTIGPQAIIALMISRFVADNKDFAVIISFLNGIVILILGFLNLGFLVQFISMPVTAGFTTAAALTIASSQIKPLLGLPGQSSDFIQAIENFFRNVDKAQLWDSILGFSTIFMLLALKKLSDIKGRFTVALKYISLARNALVVLFGTMLAYFLSQDGNSAFSLTGNVRSGLPDVKVPPLSTVVGNQTMGFVDILGHLGTSVISIPMVAIIEVIAVNKVYLRGEKSVNGTQELIALGACNLAGSFFQSMPVSGSFTRSAINHASGVRTTLGGVVTAILVVLSLVYLTESFRYIPRATLAGVIICAMIYTIEFRAAVETWRVKRIDVLPYFVTLVASLVLGLELGIVIGVGLNIAFVLYMTSRPKIHIRCYDIKGCEILLITPDQSLVYSAAEHVKRKILKHSLICSDYKTIVIDGHLVLCMDSTVAKTLKSCVEELQSNDKTVLFWNWPSQSADVAWRLGQDFGKLFKKSDTLEELTETEMQLNVISSE